MEGTVDAGKVDGSGQKVAWTSVRTRRKVLLSYGKWMKGLAETQKVDGRSCGCTKVDRSLLKVLRKHGMLTEGPMDAGNVDGRSR